MWERLHGSVRALRRGPAGDEVRVDQAVLTALGCLTVPVALFDPVAVRFAWQNDAFSAAVTPASLAAFLTAGREALAGAEPSVLRAVLLAVQVARSGGGSVDLATVPGAPLPLAPFLPTAHCHSVVFEGARLVTVQAPSLVQEAAASSETAADMLMRLIDRMLDEAGRDDPVLQDLRQRVLDDRIHEPIFAGGGQQLCWRTSASLAVMLGLPLPDGA